MIWWRFKGVGPWRFGYTSEVKGRGLMHLGNYNGDTMGGYVVDASEIEWRPHSG